MSTNSKISIKVGTAPKKSVYCHWDGYPSNMLPLLRDNYDTLEKAEELLALGDLSYLAAKVKPDAGEAHSYDRPVVGVTVAYHRDRGEKLKFSAGKQQYNYLFDGTAWNLE